MFITSFQLILWRIGQHNSSWALQNRYTLQSKRIMFWICTNSDWICDAAGTLACQYLRLFASETGAWIHGETANKVHEQSMLVRKNLILWFIPEKPLKRSGSTAELQKPAGRCWPYIMETGCLSVLFPWPEWWSQISGTSQIMMQQQIISTWLDISLTVTFAALIRLTLAQVSRL